MDLKNFTSKAYEKLFSDIIDQKITTAQTKEILITLNESSYPQESFIGAVAALKKRMVQINAPSGTVDVCGTGGDRLNTLNVSTAVCFVVAGAGVTVAKHGNKAVSSRSGSADIFSELGIKTLSNVKEIEKTLVEKNLCFLFAPFFHSSLKNLAQIRKDFAQEFSQPTIFNYLGPLLNPASTQFQLIGTSRKETMLNMLKVAADEEINNGERKGKSIYVVHGFDGMDEITLCNNSYLLRFENGKFFDQEVVDPEKFGFKKVGIESLEGGDVKYNAQKLISLLEGEKSAYRDIVILNSAFALKASGKVNQIGDGIDLARKIIDDNSALNLLHNLAS